MNPCGCATSDHIKKEWCKTFEPKWKEVFQSLSNRFDKHKTKLSVVWNSKEIEKQAEQEQLIWDAQSKQNAFLFARPSILQPQQLGVFARRCLVLEKYPEDVIEDLVIDFSINHQIEIKTNLRKMKSFFLPSPSSKSKLKPFCLGAYEGIVIDPKEANSQLMEYSISTSEGTVLSQTNPSSSWPCLVNHSVRFANVTIDPKDLKIYLIENVTRGQELFWNYGSKYWISSVLGLESPEKELKCARWLDLWNRIFFSTENYSPLFELSHELKKLDLNERFLLANETWKKNFTEMTTPAYVKQKEIIQMFEMQQRMENQKLIQE